MAEEEYSKLSDLEGRFFILGAFVLPPIAITIAIQIIIILQQHSKPIFHNNANAYYLLSLKCAIYSSLFTIGASIVIMFFCNDLIIPWDFDQYASINDSVFGIFYTFGKVLFYFGFTYHVESIVVNHNPNKKENNDAPMSIYLKLWMVFVAFANIILLIMMLINDITMHSKKEIGFIEHRNIYIAMFAGYDAEQYDFTKMLFFIVIIVDMVYVGVLCYYYLRKLKQSNIFLENGVKALILLIVSSVIFWCSLILAALGSPLRYIIPVTISDNVCLFLVFDCSDQVYQFLCCHLCNNCCSKMVYGSQYERLKQTNDNGAANNDDDSNTDTDALL